MDRQRGAVKELGAITATSAGGSQGVREGVIERGTKVRLKTDKFTYSRPHLLYHARQGDIGTVAGPSKQSPAMSKLYTIVHFEQCGHDHRVTIEEIEAVA